MVWNFVFGIYYFKLGRYLTFSVYSITLDQILKDVVKELERMKAVSSGTSEGNAERSQQRNNGSHLMQRSNMKDQNIASYGVGKVLFMTSNNRTFTSNLIGLIEAFQCNVLLLTRIDMCYFLNNILLLWTFIRNYFFSAYPCYTYTFCFHDPTCWISYGLIFYFLLKSVPDVFITLTFFLLKSAHVLHVVLISSFFLWKTWNENLKRG